MYRGPLIFGVVVLLLIVGVFTIFGGHKTPKPTSTNTVQIQPLPNYANTDATVSMTIDGVVNGDDAHRSIRITIGQNERDLDIIQGYSGRVTSHQPSYNTKDAYDVFLRAINNSGFLLPLKKTKAPADERGLCPQGFRYIFELKQNGSDLSRLWGSTCGQSIGTLGGSSSQLQSLFEAQITDYQELTSQTELGG